ncbi:hypothetical protein MK974_09535 [Burkholderia ambifaria]|uniref:hypothetical protein n=1 Tax=Burkholderia ambifaria TaxID=152480 RepID=UPI0022A94807|nr:hypothetical protein [Burkholderia ambifaria]WAS52982.1 hypothetical protein MK974_09535 [Burkholderia ambifaria]
MSTPPGVRANNSSSRKSEAASHDPTRSMPGTSIAKARAAPNSQNPTPAAQPRVKHRQMTYTDIHCRSIFAEFQILLSQIHPDSNILPTYLAIIASSFEAISQEYSKSLLTPSLSEL